MAFFFAKKVDSDFKMNVAVDIGNTLIKVGSFDGPSLQSVEFFEIERDSRDFIEAISPENIIVSSVTNDGKIWSDLAKNRFVRLNSTTPLPVRNLYNTPDTLGTDRLAGCIGAHALYPGTNCLVVDAGTCIKCDFIDKEAKFHGGSISPGLKMRFESLNHFTAKLPLIEKKIIDFVTGKSTEESILNGVMNGALFEIEGFIENYIKIFPQLNVILTGGDLGSFESKIKQHIFVVPNLVLLGLNKILLYNLKVWNRRTGA
jgi:type III pantothenate kinase